MSDRVIISIGTKKGLFVGEASKHREMFSLRRPFGEGVSVYSALIETRGTPDLYASSCNAFFGMEILHSNDLGGTFTETKAAPAFPKNDGRALANIWALESGSERNELWCEVEPASLFRSEDSGNSWEIIAGISNHQHSREWQPGQGGLCLHTILRDGDRMHLGISTGGHYAYSGGSSSTTRRCGATVRAGARRPMCFLACFIFGMLGRLLARCSEEPPLLVGETSDTQKT